MSFVLEYAFKASVAFLVAVGGGVGVALSDGALTQQETLISLGSGLLAFVAVFRTVNGPALFDGEAGDL